MAMLKVTDLEVCYGVIRAIKGISFEVNKGEVVALIGANGAGKTTILHTITGLIPSKAGKIEYEGKDITKLQVLIEKTVLYTETGRWIGESFLPEA